MKQKKMYKKYIIIAVIFSLIIISIGVTLFLKDNKKDSKKGKNSENDNFSVLEYEKASKMAEELYLNENRTVKTEDDPHNKRFIIYVKDLKTGKLIYKFYLYKENGFIEQDYGATGSGLGKKKAINAN